MRRTFWPAPTARVVSPPATTPMSSSSMRPIGATWTTTWRGTWWALSSVVAVSRGRARVAPMATKKQRRRRQKDRRHEWEYVYVDDEGEEVEVEEAESPTPRKAEARTKAGKKQPGRAGRSVEPPSWRKVGKRGLLFAPLILITHTHWDHLGAVADLAEGTGAPVYAPERERPVLERPGDYYPGVSIRSWSPEHTLEGGETVELAGISFEVISVPSHSPGHLAYYADGCLFSGDVLFAGSVGRTDLPGGDWETLLASIRSLADRLL